MNIEGRWWRPSLSQQCRLLTNLADSSAGLEVLQVENGSMPTPFVPTTGLNLKKGLV